LFIEPGILARFGELNLMESKSDRSSGSEYKTSESVGSLQTGCIGRFLTGGLTFKRSRGFNIGMNFLSTFKTYYVLKAKGYGKGSDSDAKDAAKLGSLSLPSLQIGFSL
jgi:hypothetical protein